MINIWVTVDRQHVKNRRKSYLGQGVLRNQELLKLELLREDRAASLRMKQDMSSLFLRAEKIYRTETMELLPRTR